MTWQRLTLAVTIGLAASACSLFGGEEEPEAAAADTTAQQQAAAPAPVEPTPAPAVPVRRPARQPVRPQVDEPWFPTDTGTVAPGMSRDDVIAVWGVPVAERVAGTRTYLYFRNGCEFSCGTFDVVFLDQGGVVDVIARGPGHTYAGTSSSPPGTLPAATIPGMPLTVPTDSTSTDARE